MSLHLMLHKQKHAGSVCFLKVIILLFTAIFPSQVFAICQYDIKESILSFKKFHESNAWSCINLQTRSQVKRENRLKALINDMRTYVFDKNGGAIEIGEPFNIDNYYDRDMSIQELYDQLTESGFQYNGAILDKTCINMFLDNTETLNSKCNKCIINISFSYHDLLRKSIFSIGYPIYRISLTFKANSIISFKARIVARK